jgi:L-asparaginase/Glu-tRNA(Gln) amidotransferase subunit D
LHRLGDLGAGEAKAVVIELLVPRSTLTSTHIATSLQNAKKKGLLIVMTSPNPLPRWGVSRSGGGGRNGGLAEEDVVDALDMTTEACCAKLAYLFGKGLSSAQVV